MSMWPPPNLAYGQNFKARWRSAGSQNRWGKAPGDPSPAAKVSNAPSWCPADIPAFIPARLMVAEPLDGSRGLLRLGFHLLICGHTDQGVQARAPLRGYAEPHCCPHAAPRKVSLGSLIFFILFDVLSWSSGSWRWIISQMDTSDLLENISCLVLTNTKTNRCLNMRDRIQTVVCSGGRSRTQVSKRNERRGGGSISVVF